MSKKMPHRASSAIQASDKLADLKPDLQLPGEALTTNQGLVVGDDQNSLKAGVRGPTLLEDFHFREKITHFDHERIPERVVHARGAAAHGFFECTDPAGDITQATLFAAKGKRTPVFVRFSTVAGSRGSADTPRDVRGFSIKFYSDQGIWDLVGNNMPVFFIQDAIKFPDLIHAVKPEPHNEIPQAASAHDTFYDFISLTPEAAHMLMWVMSDRALPRSFSNMEGFGVHTFRMINAKGKSVFVKFHFKPVKGVHSLCWDEAQKLAGKDADFNRRDLADSIDRGDFPEWQMGVQVVEEADEFKFNFDLLDPTKLIPEELVPVRILGRLVLDRNPENYFAETEQVAFHPGHLVPGIDFSNDPLLQGRLFSYIDTQLKRVGPNFAQLPINRPTCPVHNNQRDGQGQQRIPTGTVSYFPNALAGGCPMHSAPGVAAFSSHMEKMEGSKVRARSPSFADHFSQATMFWNSMADWEKTHIVDAFSFELNMVQTLSIREKFLNEILANIADELSARVGDKIGLTPRRHAPTGITPEVNAPVPLVRGKARVESSDALSMDHIAEGIKGRKVAILVCDGASAAEIDLMKTRLKAEGALCEMIASKPGMVKPNKGKDIAVDRPAPNAPSVVFDAVFLPSGTALLAGQTLPVQFTAEAYQHGKPILAMGDGVAVLNRANIPSPQADALSPDQGVVTPVHYKSIANGIDLLIEAMKHHRFYGRNVEVIPVVKA